MAARLASLLVLMGSATAQTQAPASDAEQMWLDAAGRGTLLQGSGLTLGTSQYRVGVAAMYARGSLRPAGNPAGLIPDRLGAHVFGAIGVTQWLELSADIPVTIAQTTAPVLSAAPAGLGNPLLGAAVNLLDHEQPVALAAGLGVSVPVGTAVAQGNGGIAFLPRLTLGKVFDGFQVGGELSALLRAAVDYGPVTSGLADRVGSQLFVAAMASGVSAEGPRGELTARLGIPLTGASVGLEVQIGLRWPLGPLELFASVGPGLFGEPSTPSVRSYLGFSFANLPLTQPSCVEGRPYIIGRCPMLDFDSDGIVNGEDRAPMRPEDFDGFEDGDGVPDLDNDGDAVADALDDCPNEAGPSDRRGCPQRDADGDGVLDGEDACPIAPEDRDGVEDADGCPEEGASAPADGAAGEVEADGDGDTVPDAEDDCPTVAGSSQHRGCLAQERPLVVITTKSLDIAERILFETGSATIRPGSYPLLGQVASALADHPELALVQIEGHTDSLGPVDANQRLSQARADAVKAFLVNSGIDARRLRAVGFGGARPLQPNDTASGRDANRRVEFNLIEQ